MKIVNIHAAKTQLSRLIADVLAGEEVVIAKAGTPLVRLVPASVNDAPRALGILAGAVVEAEDCWAPDTEIDVLFYGRDVEPTPSRRGAEARPAWYARSATP